ncbi:unnamed protein product [Laminaria digitata]
MNMCRTPLKQAERRSAAGSSLRGGRVASREGWSGGSCATPPALATGTPCSGSKFRSGDGDESEYSDYEQYCAVKPTPSKRVATPPSATKRLFADAVEESTGRMPRRSLEGAGNHR